MTSASPRTPARAEYATFVCLAISAVAAVGLAVTYALGGQPQVEGALLGVSLSMLGVGLVLWAHHFMPRGPFEERRHRLASPPEERAEMEEAFERHGELTRRKLLIGGLAGSVGALVVAFVFPVRSLGPSPGKSLERTPWRRGTRAITEDGRDVRASEVPLGGLVTIFPAGHPDSADGQVVLVRVHPDELRLPPGRSSWAPDGLVAYSKVCTHAGCPVGLYQAASAQLLCPCHQSAFDVLDGAKPVFGPAARALPQLPLAIDDEGFVVAQSDFHEPIGPAYWNRP
ncbi:MAG TPA: Rieske 2Fe-2S domain-containing protein [Acidimicrobiia bacterium]